MKVDILFLAYNRLAFTKESCAARDANTDWDRVSRLIIYDDGSLDGTRAFLGHYGQVYNGVPVEIRDTNIKSPVGIMNDYLNSATVEYFVKLDNDVIVPPNWLGDCISVVEKDNLDLLGIEPVCSRTKNPQTFFGYPVIPNAEENFPGPLRSIKCQSIGGIGLMRTGCFKENGAMSPYAIYGGFTTWQEVRPLLKIGWMAPALKLFLLDRLPMNPWKDLSKEYIKQGYQRPWTDYEPTLASSLWSWWTPAYAK